MRVEGILQQLVEQSRLSWRICNRMGQTALVHFDTAYDAYDVILSNSIRETLEREHTTTLTTGITIRRGVECLALAGWAQEMTAI